MTCYWGNGYDNQRKIGINSIGTFIHTLHSLGWQITTTKCIEYLISKLVRLPLILKYN